MAVEYDGLSAAAHFLIQEWPDILKPWGFTKSAARIHSVLLVHPDALTADELHAATDISRGGISEQLRILCEAGLVDRLRILGHRQDQFSAIRDGQQIQRALLGHWAKKILLPMDRMKESLAAITDKHDLPWYEVIRDLRSSFDE